MKHIEQILPEQAAFELDRIGREETDATATAALTCLLQDWTGCNIPQTDTAPQSEVDELVPLCVSILRRHWQTPLTCLGDGDTPMSLADLMRQLIDRRVQGNEALGIPAANSNIASAVAALTKRHIDDGLTLTLSANGGDAALPDGISLAQVLCGTSPDGTDLASQVTEIRDSNKGWTMSKANMLSTIAGIFTNMSEVTLGCAEVTCNILYRDNSTIKKITFSHLTSTTYALIRMDGNGEQRLYVEEMIFPQLQRMGCLMEHRGNGWWTSQLPNLHNVSFPKLKEITQQGGGRGAFFEIPCPSLEVLEFPELESMNRPLYGGSCLSNLRELRMPKTKNINFCHGTYAENISANLVLLEVGEGIATSINLTYWSPTTALAERLDEFLRNFQTYIANRVADMTGIATLTLTLSSAVYAALEEQEGQTILATLASKNWNVAQA